MQLVTLQQHVVNNVLFVGIKLEQQANLPWQETFIKITEGQAKEMVSTLPLLISTYTV